MCLGKRVVAEGARNGPSVLVLRSLGEGGCSANVPGGKVCFRLVGRADSGRRRCLWGNMPCCGRAERLLGQSARGKARHRALRKCAPPSGRAARPFAAVVARVECAPSRREGAPPCAPSCPWRIIRLMWDGRAPLSSVALAKEDARPGCPWEGTRIGAPPCTVRWCHPSTHT